MSAPAGAEKDAPVPAHVDAAGPWWLVDELPHWWVRQRADGAWDVKHQHGDLSAVHAHNMYRLAVLVQREEIVDAHAERDQLPFHQIDNPQGDQVVEPGEMPERLAEMGRPGAAVEALARVLGASALVAEFADLTVMGGGA